MIRLRSVRALLADVCRLTELVAGTLAEVFEPRHETTAAILAERGES